MVPKIPANNGEEQDEPHSEPIGSSGDTNDTSGGSTGEEVGEGTSQKVPAGSDTSQPRGTRHLPGFDPATFLTSIDKYVDEKLKNAFKTMNVSDPKSGGNGRAGYYGGPGRIRTRDFRLSPPIEVPKACAISPDSAPYPD